MKLMINGQEKSVPHHLQTILDLLQELNLDPGFIIVEKNGEILDKNTFTSTPVQNGDRLELVKFVGGG
ncbi:sulfur carrier protein [Melghiribacillus thermohalophilus]|uniref:Sulfur carrier protein n=1 Tax=Melghiribacillus thermohalophilus TaxID=1324956 RepID=A0A4R3MUK8_9BACI|nr:sulfur carrier protein ThiS [Melghiribacillus thermohalophilus]TCT20024.1 sulfur carrier protein [Melghiribacillus thermohalophilus]